MADIKDGEVDILLKYLVEIASPYLYTSETYVQSGHSPEAVTRDNLNGMRRHTLTADEMKIIGGNELYYAFLAIQDIAILYKIENPSSTEQVRPEGYETYFKTNFENYYYYRKTGKVDDIENIDHKLALIIAEDMKISVWDVLWKSKDKVFSIVTSGKNPFLIGNSLLDMWNTEFTHKYSVANPDNHANLIESIESLTIDGFTDSQNAWYRAALISRYAAKNIHPNERARYNAKAIELLAAAQAETAKKIDEIYDFIIPSAEELAAKEKTAELQRKIDNYKAIYLASALFAKHALKDEKLSQQISIVGDESINIFFLASNIATAPAGNYLAYVQLVNSVINIITVLTGGDNPNPHQIILDSIKSLSHQVYEFRQYMATRMDALAKQATAYHAEVLNQFCDLRDATDNIIRNITEIKESIHNLERQRQSDQRLTLGINADIAIHSLNSHQAGSPFYTDMPSHKFYDYADLLMFWMTNTDAHSIYNGSNLLQHHSASAALTSFVNKATPLEHIAIVATAFHQVLYGSVGIPATESMVNPFIWIKMAEAYLKLLQNINNKFPAGDNTLPQKAIALADDLNAFIELFKKPEIFLSLITLYSKKLKELNQLLTHAIEDFNNRIKLDTIEFVTSAPADENDEPQITEPPEDADTEVTTNSNAGLIDNEAGLVQATPESNSQPTTTTTVIKESELRDALPTQITVINDTDRIGPISSALFQNELIEHLPPEAALLVKHSVGAVEVDVKISTGVIGSAYKKCGKKPDGKKQAQEMKDKGELKYLVTGYPNQEIKSYLYTEKKFEFTLYFTAHSNPERIPLITFEVGKLFDGDGLVPKEGAALCTKNASPSKIYDWLFANNYHMTWRIIRVPERMSETEIIQRCIRSTNTKIESSPPNFIGMMKLHMHQQEFISGEWEKFCRTACSDSTTLGLQVHKILKTLALYKKLFESALSIGGIELLEHNPGLAFQFFIVTSEIQDALENNSVRRIMALTENFGDKAADQVKEEFTSLFEKPIPETAVETKLKETTTKLRTLMTT